MVRRAMSGLVFVLMIAGLRQAPAPAASPATHVKNDYSNGKSTAGGTRR